MIRNYMFYATRSGKNIVKVKWEAKQDRKKWNEEKLLISSMTTTQQYDGINK